MLKKLHRVAKQGDFQKIKKHGQSFYLPSIAIRCLKTGRPNSRFGFIVSNKISKKAVERNRIRRRLSEAVGSQLDWVISGVDCVIVVRPAIKRDKYCDIEQKIRKLFQRAGIIKKHGKIA